MYRPLHDGWTLHGPAHLPDAVPATVPGCVHTDLLVAGLIADPYLGENEHLIDWIGRTDWTYRTTVDWPATDADRVELVCAGLDTVAMVRCNGVEVGRTENMHRGYRFPVRDHLRPGANTVEVEFAQPYGYALAQRARLGARPGPYPEPYQFIRKMAANFGWDWGPTLVTAGIWRPIGLHAWSGARLAEVRPLVGGDGVDVLVRIERSAAGPVTVAAEVAGVAASVELAGDAVAARLTLDVPDARRWQPRGHGDQPLYPLTVTAGEDVWRRRIGFRTVELEPDAFRLVVNGEPIFVRGFNWIPDDCFPSRVTRADLRERFDQALDAGANALRVWGGGCYESDEFYQLADEAGLLVWQDFAFACAAYPEDEPFWSEVEAEARDNVVRLMSHPSLVLWCGNNENIEGQQHWGWPAELAGRTWGAGFYFDLLPRVVAELDPTRPYWPGTPYSGDPARDTRDPGTGTIHIWTVWGQGEDYLRYGDYTPRFVAEFGYQGPPTFATLDVAGNHQKAVGGDEKLLRGLDGHLPAPVSRADWHYYTQLNQARAVCYGVERFRALAPYCMGTIVWQLNDCWPVTSWAAVDGAGRRKPLWYALRRSYADRLVTVVDGTVALVNDTDEVWSGPLVLARRDLASVVLDSTAERVTVPPREVLRVPLAMTVGDPSAELLTAYFGGLRTLHFAAEDVEIGYPPATFAARADPVPGGFRVTITAETIVRDLALFPDRLDPAATVDDQLVTLLPGEQVTWNVTTEADLGAGLLAYPVLRCVNEAVPKS